ncbi:hypothetical protein B0H14DRAFT_3539624 [Mycena olivaceomarginata]|nr:hypothetical protein B0H14DRAFT_3539624 [Mycena olivaceomarginata]
MSPRPCYYRINNLATPDINSPHLLLLPETATLVVDSPTLSDNRSGSSRSGYIFTVWLHSPTRPASSPHIPYQPMQGSRDLPHKPYQPTLHPSNVSLSLSKCWRMLHPPRGRVAHPGRDVCGDSLRILIDGLQSFVAQIPNSEQFAIRRLSHPRPRHLKKRSTHPALSLESRPFGWPICCINIPLLSYEILHRVVLVFWISEGCSALVQAISRSPALAAELPQIRLSDISRLLTSRAYPHLDSFYEYFCIELQSWISSSLSGVLASSAEIKPTTSHAYQSPARLARASHHRRPLAIDVQGSSEGDDHAKIKLEPMTPPRVQLKRKAPAPAIQDEVKVKLEPATPPTKRQYLGFIDLTTPSPPSLSYSISSTSIASSSSSEFPQPLHLLSALRGP